MTGAFSSAPTGLDTQKALFISPNGIVEGLYADGLPNDVIMEGKEYGLVAYGFRVGIYFEKIAVGEGGSA